MYNGIFAFLAQSAASCFKKAVLAAHCCFVLKAETIASLNQDAEDVKYQAKVAACDCVAGDRIDAEGF